MTCVRNAQSCVRSLEPNHSHFLLVDCQDGGNELARFRAELLQHYATPLERTHHRSYSVVIQTLFIVNGPGISAMTLLVGGDLTSLRHACYALQVNTPLMVCEMPTAGAAEVLLTAMRRYRRRSNQ